MEIYLVLGLLDYLESVVLIINTGAGTPDAHIYINDCDISANLLTYSNGGITTQSFENLSQNSTLFIDNCHFTGDVSSNLLTGGSGGLFGNDCFLNNYYDNTIIQNCSATGTISAVDIAGGIFGKQCFQNCDGECTISNCNFTGNIYNGGAGGNGGIFGYSALIDVSDNAVLNIQNCDVSAVLYGTNNGGLFGGNTFNSNSGTNPGAIINISGCNISVSLQGDSMGAMFGNYTLWSNGGTGFESTLNITNNTIHITDISDGDYYSAIFLEDSGTNFNNYDCSVNILNNTITSDVDVSLNTFGTFYNINLGGGGAFGTAAGAGTLTISGNDLTGLQYSGSYPTDIKNLLVSTDSIQYFNGGGAEEMYSTLNIPNTNTYPPNTIDISNIATWQAACEYWTTISNPGDTFRLIANPVDLSMSTLNGLADTSNNFNEFTAMFDGQGNTLVLDGTGTTDISKSLFMDLKGGIIKNFTFDISGCASGSAVKGFLVGTTLTTNSNYYGNLYDIYVNNIGSAIAVGGNGGYMVGQSFGYECATTIEVSGCSFTGNINEPESGGLFGCCLFHQGIGTLQITNCDVSGTISGHQSGGLMGSLCGSNASGVSNIFIENCTFNGIVDASGAGGLIGYDLVSSNGGELTISGCSINATINGEVAGGMCGRRTAPDFSGNATITNCNFNGTISTDASGAGGLFGEIAFGGLDNTGTVSITNCDVSGVIDADIAGGIAGQYAFQFMQVAAGNVDICNCSFNGTISTDASGAGGLFGRSLFRSGQGDITIQNCDITGSVEGQDAGGLGGYGSFGQCTTDANITISNCNFNGDVSSLQAGGLFGNYLCYQGEGDITIQNCDISGNITGQSGGGIGGNSSFEQCTTDASINITNCNIIGDVTGLYAGGLFGPLLFSQGAGNITIQNCDIIGNIGNTVNNDGGGICGYYSFASSGVNSNIIVDNCNFTGDVIGGLTGYSGGLFGTFLFNAALGTLTIQNCDISGNVTGEYSGGLCATSFNAVTNATIDISKCSFTGEISGEHSGGLFANNCFQDSSCNVVVKNCDISGTISAPNSGGIFGPTAFQDSSGQVEIDTCSYTGTISGANSGGLLAEWFISGSTQDVSIHDCSITAVLNGLNTGGLGGKDCFVDSCFNTIDIYNNTINADLQGSYSSAMISSWLFNGNSNNTFNINNNTITITGIDVAEQTAGISTYEYDAVDPFKNLDLSVNITNNTISTSVTVNSSTFGGLFNVDALPNPLTLLTPTGLGTLTVTDNNFSGIQLTTIPAHDEELKYLFNNDGIPFYDTSVHDKIFLTVIINGNTYGPLHPAPTVPMDFSTYSYLLQWIYNHSLESLMDQKWFESYSLYMPRAQVKR